MVAEEQEIPSKATSQVIFSRWETSQPVFWSSRLAAGVVMVVSMYPVRSPQPERRRVGCLSGLVAVAGLEAMPRVPAMN
ncbi:hypothetical protein F8606_25445 [Salmonella enterica]|nr:hypothetical protein [Salmonella enterica]ECZ8128297.1 hypothetical protein [Salmonella enterica]EIW3447528.1 hypothetical protein [Salmonella enterica]